MSIIETKRFFFNTDNGHLFEEVIKYNEETNNIILVSNAVSEVKAGVTYQEYINIGIKDNLKTLVEEEFLKLLDEKKELIASIESKHKEEFEKRVGFKSQIAKKVQTLLNLSDEEAEVLFGTKVFNGGE